MGAPRDPLEGIERLLIDGNNLLGAMRRGTGLGPTGRLPAAALIGRLRAVIPPDVRIELVFDGPPDPGTGGVRVASGVTVRYAGRISADALLVRLVTEAAPFTLDHAATLLVVTDDTALSAELRRRGAVTARTQWLIRRLERTSVGSATRGGAARAGGGGSTGGGPVGRPVSRPAGRPVGIGNARPPRVGGAGPGTSGAVADEDAERPGWRPGRGATTKKGNARRLPRSARDGC